MLWSASSFGAGPRRQLWEIVLPAAMPQIFTGLQIALPIAMIVAIVTEMALEGQGLGAMTISSMRYLDFNRRLRGTAGDGHRRVGADQNNRSHPQAHSCLASGSRGGLVRPGAHHTAETICAPDRARASSPRPTGRRRFRWICL